MKVCVVGAGVFGVTGALALAAQGHAVTIIDPGPLPRPEAASTDRSKIVRAAYGDDAIYTRMACDAIDGWHRWNARWGEGLARHQSSDRGRGLARQGRAPSQPATQSYHEIRRGSGREGKPALACETAAESPSESLPSPESLYHQDGFLMLSRDTEMPSDGYEAMSHATLDAIGWPVERLDADAIAERFPAWRGHPSGFLDHRAGWAAATAVMKRLHADARAAGVALRGGVAARALVERGGRVVGVETGAGVIEADCTVVAAGAWTPLLVPTLGGLMRATGHPILVFRVTDPAPWRPPRFVPWAADIARTGWYGFPARADGTIKIARHAAGVPLDPNGPRVVGPEVVEAARAFLADALPALADAPLVSTRLCAYCDTADGHFLIDRDPDRDGLVVAAGGSGHGFKFAPVLGARVAAAVDGRRAAIEPRFYWRTAAARGAEGARAT